MSEKSESRDMGEDAKDSGTTNEPDDVIQVATDAGHIVSVVGSVYREQRGEK